MSTYSEQLRKAEATLYRTLDEHPDLAPEVAERSNRLESFQLSLFRFMCYAVPPRIGGPHYGRFTVCRCTVSPDGVSGFHQPDARGVSDLDLPLRGRVPGAYGGVALRWDTPDGPPIYRLQELPVA